jgi:hypothetical protein
MSVSRWEPEDETSELELIAKALQEISKEISHEGLAKALLKAALGYSRAARGAVLLSGAPCENCRQNP